MTLTRSEINRRFYQRHLDAQRKRGREYGAAHKDEKAAYMNCHRQDNRERLLASSRDRMRHLREANPEKYRERDRVRWADNKSNRRLKQRVWGQRYLARRRALPATLTHAEWQEILEHYQNRCAYCGRDSDILVQEHVIPVSKGGGFTKDNIVPACSCCNLRKGNRLVPYPLKQTDMVRVKI